MQIKTLEFIHDLLRAEVTARAAQKAAAEEHAVRLASATVKFPDEAPILNQQRKKATELAETATSDYFTAYRALTDFEAHSWR